MCHHLDWEQLFHSELGVELSKANTIVRKSTVSLEQYPMETMKAFSKLAHKRTDFILRTRLVGREHNHGNICNYALNQRYKTV